VANQKQDEGNQPERADTSPPSLSPKGASRRRFAQSGAAVTGVLLTIASRPGMACEICTTPSGYCSSNLSPHGTKTVVCAGRSPGYWKNCSTWPSGCHTTTTFGSVFSCDTAHKTYKTCTMGTIVSPQSWDTYNVGMHLTGAYLNVKAGITSYLTVAMLQSMWTEYQSKGYYTPTYGKKWYGSDIVAYLQGTMY